MRIKLIEDTRINHYEMLLTFHPKNKEVAKKTMDKMNDTLFNIIGMDEYRNRYPISILSIYYIEKVDQKVFIYTKREVYRVTEKLPDLKAKLQPHGFYQINVRTLVNSYCVDKFAYKKDCHREIYMHNDEILISNRSYREECDRMIQENDIENHRKKRKTNTRE